MVNKWGWWRRPDLEVRGQKSKRVWKQFRVGDVVTTYDGDITHVHFVQDVGQFMMHVSYDDDDSEDYEEYEVKEYLLEDD